jgi:hypothetical protein
MFSQGSIEGVMFNSLNWLRRIFPLIYLLKNEKEILKV